MTNKKLRSTRISSRVGHGDYPAIMVLIFTRKLTFDFVTWAAVSDPVGTATLNHKVWNNPMENKSVVEIMFREVDKVLYGIWSVFFKELDFHDAFFCMDFCNFHFWRFNRDASLRDASN
jgi:hypothetical protein